MDPDGNPVAEMEQVPVFEEREISYVTTEKNCCQLYGIRRKKNTGSRVENKTDWSGKQRQ